MEFLILILLIFFIYFELKSFKHRNAIVSNLAANLDDASIKKELDEIHQKEINHNNTRALWNELQNLALTAKKNRDGSFNQRSKTGKRLAKYYEPVSRVIISEEEELKLKKINIKNLVYKNQKYIFDTIVQSRTCRILLMLLLCFNVINIYFELGFIYYILLLVIVYIACKGHEINIIKTNKLFKFQ